ncbi:MAG TPA: toll/interleukin-1 receptor domain-containing protein [Candidatus Acidoferrum sp.]|nr:toll/interleukin-1 receptor domain-containing protein [Candidatus Acidoferrum sp.]
MNDKESGSANGVFLSYRRDDVQGWAGRLSDSIKQSFGDAPLFFDRESIRPGDDFVDALEGAVGSCAVLLALIGRGWLDARDGAGRRRLDDPNDFVRLEIATALRRRIRVIPVLLGGATIPAVDALPDDLQALARRQAHELSDSRWPSDVEVLFKILEESLGPRRSPAEDEAATIDVAEGLVVEGANVGDIAGIKSEEPVTKHGPIDVLKGGVIRNSNVGDIVGIKQQSSDRAKKPRPQ